MNIALILSGGMGRRIGSDIPKQYIKVDDRTILSYSLETLLSSESVDAVQIVADRDWKDTILSEILSLKLDSNHKFRGFSSPGVTRQLSIYNGLKDIGSFAESDDRVLIHDAARPCVTAEMVTKCFDAVSGEYEGAMPVLPMKDTVYRSMDGKMITGLLEREHIFAGQAPEVFIYGKYLEANERLLPKKIYEINGSSEPAIKAGMHVAMIPGDEGNFKITTPEDFDRFVSIVAEKLR